jgi:hypothetical protein
MKKGDRRRIGNGTTAGLRYGLAMKQEKGKREI